MSSASQRFDQLVEKVFSDKAALARATDFRAYERLFSGEYDEILKLIVAATDTEALLPLMRSYLVLYDKYLQNTENVHYHRSDEIFYKLISQSAKVPIGKRDLFEIYASKIEGDDKTESLKRRHLALSETVRGQVITLIKETRAKRKAEKSILDLLKDEYQKRNGQAAGSVSDLYDFDPWPGEAFKYDFEQQLKFLNEAWKLCFGSFTKESQLALNLALNRFQLYANRLAGENTLKLFQVIKYLQDIVRDKREPIMSGSGPGTKLTPGNLDPIVVEAYSIACVQLMVHAAKALLLSKNKDGFTASDNAYFLAPVANYKYASNVSIRFSTDLRRVPAMESLFGQSKHFLNLLLLTRHQLQGMTLVDMGKVLEIQKFWQQVRQLGDLVKDKSRPDQERILKQNLAIVDKLVEVAGTEIRVEGNRPELAKGTLGVGDSFGQQRTHGSMSIIYINPRNTNEVYVEINALKPQLFLVNAKYVEDKLYGTRIYDIYASTIGMVYINDGILLAVGFLPVFIEAGFVGLLYEIGVYVASGQVAEIIGEINPTAGKIAGGLTLLLTPRPSFKPKVFNPNLPARSSVIVLETAGTLPQRSFAEMIQAGREESMLINRGTVARIKDKIADTAVAAKDKIADRAVDLQKKWERTTEAVRQKIPEILPARELATAGGPRGGPMLRVRDAGKTSGSRSGTSGGSRGTSEPSPAEIRLRKSDKLRQLEDYYELLTKAERQLAEQEVLTIMRELRQGKLAPRDATQRVINLLNNAKELTGEYVADGLVYSNFKVLSEVRIPRRNNGVPILDKVYKVRNPKTKEIEFLVVEVKGGTKTPLGKVTAKRYEREGKLVTFTVDPDRMVRQGTGEWYYQKIIEIFNTPGAGNKDLARQLFAAAKSKKLQSAIVKSGREMDPLVKRLPGSKESPKWRGSWDDIGSTTDDVLKFFEKLQSPFP